MNLERPSDFSRTVKNARQQAGLSQQQLADKAGVTRQLIARLENGSGDTSLANALRVLNALGVKLAIAEVGDSADAPGIDSQNSSDLGAIAAEALRRVKLPTVPIAAFRTLDDQNLQETVKRLQASNQEGLKRAMRAATSALTQRPRPLREPHPENDEEQSDA